MASKVAIGQGFWNLNNLSLPFTKPKFCFETLEDWVNSVKSHTRTTTPSVKWYKFPSGNSMIFPKVCFRHVLSIKWFVMSTLEMQRKYFVDQLFQRWH